MSNNTRGKLGENYSFAQLIENLRKAEEAATELGMHRSDGRWMQVATLMQQIRSQIISLANSRTNP